MDELLALEAFEHVTDGRSIESNHGREASGIDARVLAHRYKSSILHRRKLEFGALLHKYGNGNLLRATEEVARLCEDVVHGHFFAVLTPCRVAAPAQQRRKQRERHCGGFCRQ